MKQVLLLILALFVLSTKAQIEVDSLAIFQAVVRAEGTLAGTTVESSSPAPIADASYLGSRLLYARADNAGQGDEVATRAPTGGLQCNVGSGSSGICEWRYSSIANVDLLATGCGCFALVEDGPDQIHRLQVTTTSGGNTAVSTSPVLDPLPGAERLVCLPLQPPFGAYQSVTNLVLQADGTLMEQLDVDLRQFCCIPPTSAWHTIAPGPYVAGSCTAFTLNIRSYVRVPAANEQFSYSYSLNGLGTVTGGSLSCTNGVTGNIDAGSGSISGGGTLADGITSMCTFEVCWTTGGMADFSAVITSTRIGNSYFSNADVNPFDDPDPDRVCRPNSPTTVMVQLPPTTLPPTTMPPTTEPPTTEPPTTQPPTTEPPTTEPPTTLPPTTLPPITQPPTTQPPTTMPPTTEPPTTEPPTTEPPTTEPPTTEPPTTEPPTTLPPITQPPTTQPPTTLPPTTNPPTTEPPTTEPPTTNPPTTAPPTTEPPTTEPPTTAPPTTAPPTTQPPTTLPPTPPPHVCIWANIQDGQCMCKSFQCVCQGEGVNRVCECPADEWYCFFVDPLELNSNVFDVNYCGSDNVLQRCVCDVNGNVISGPTVIDW